jgi:hypothetical protein
LRERLRAKSSRLRPKVSLGVTLRGLELLERGRRLVAQRDEVAIVQLREQLRLARRLSPICTWSRFTTPEIRDRPCTSAPTRGLITPVALTCAAMS